MNLKPQAPQLRLALAVAQMATDRQDMAIMFEAWVTPAVEMLTTAAFTCRTSGAKPA